MNDIFLGKVLVTYIIDFTLLMSHFLNWIESESMLKITVIYYCTIIFLINFVQAHVLLQTQKFCLLSFVFYKKVPVIKIRFYQF